MHERKIIMGRLDFLPALVTMDSLRKFILWLEYCYSLHEDGPW